MSGDVVSRETSDLLSQIDVSSVDVPKNIYDLLFEVKRHIYFLESEIAQLKKACAEWSEVSQHNYQKAKSMALALDAIKAVVKATSTTGETE